MRDLPPLPCREEAKLDYEGEKKGYSSSIINLYLCPVALGEHRNTGLSTVRLSKELLHNTLTLQDFAYIDVTNGGIYNRTSAEYAINDQLHAMLGYDYFHADNGMFNIYDKNSEIWLKLKYSF